MYQEEYSTDNYLCASRILRIAKFLAVGLLLQAQEQTHLKIVATIC